MFRKKHHRSSARLGASARSCASVRSCASSPPCSSSSLSVSARLCALAAFVCCVPCASAQLTESGGNADRAVHLRVSQPAAPGVIPKTLFGSFLEPIGKSTYGGLWADAVQNPSLEEGLWSAGNVADMLQTRPELRRASDLGLPLPWEPLDGRQGNRYLAVRGDAANSNQSLLLMSLPEKEVGIKQMVYLPVQRELTYNCTLMVKHVRGEGTVEVSLRRHNHPEQILSTATVDAGAETWQPYKVALTLNHGDLRPLEPVDLVISIRNDARALLDQVTLFPADAVGGMDPDVVAMAKALHSPEVRFGGNYTSAYNWKDGVGPQEKRVSMINPSWGIPEYNTFGTDEFLKFCELIGAEPQIALNLGTGKPEEAADWVRYVDAHWGNHQGGLLWELGNELWGDFQIGYPSQQRIAAVTLATSQAVRAVDPRARLIATGGDEDHFRDWNAQQLTNPPGTFDYLSTHFVVNDNVQINADIDFRTMAALALPWGLGERMHGIQQQAAAAGHTQAKVAFTEWLMISDDRRGLNYSNQGGALFAGGFLNMLMRNSDVVSVSDMTGIIDFAGISKKRSRVYGAPAYWVLREVAQAEPHWLLDVASDGPTYSVTHGVTRLPEIGGVPYLDCVASEPENRAELVLTCVNRHLTRPMQAELDLSAFRTAGGKVQVATIAADSILAENDERRPERVHPVRDQLPVARTLAYIFPNASVTVMRVPLRK